MSEHASDDKPRIHDPKAYWLDDKGNAGKVFYAICAIAAVLFVTDAFYHKHPHFAAEEWFGFYAVAGFAACAGLVLVAKLMHAFLKRDEEYYEKHE